MDNSVREMSEKFQNQIYNQYTNLEIKDQFTFLVDLNNYLSGIIKDLIGNNYVDIATQLRDEELRIDEVHKYVGKIVQVLRIDNKLPTDLDKATQDLFELIDELEKERISNEDSKETSEKRIQDYLANLIDYM